MPSSKMSDLSFAMRMRDAIADFVRAELGKTRPLPKFGRVIAFNRITLTADVLFNGDTVATRVKTTRGCEPTESDATHGVGQGNMVRVEGPFGNQWITAVLDGPNFLDEANLRHPRLWGGESNVQDYASYFAMPADLPAIGNAVYVGRFQKSAVIVDTATIILDAVIIQGGGSSVAKRFFVAASANDTAGSWRRAACESSSGPYGLDDFELEFKTTESAVELRVRRVDSDAASPGGYDISIWIYGRGWERDTDAVPFEDSDPAPDATHGVNTPTFNSGWGLYGGEYMDVAYSRSGDRVFAEGLLKNTSASTSISGDVAFSISNGFRPEGRIIFEQNGTSGPHRVDVKANGDFIIMGAIPSAGYVTLDGMSWRAVN